MKGLNLHGTRRARMFEWHRIALFACAASLGCSPSGSEPSSAHENTGRDRGGTSGASSGGKGAGGSTGIALGGAVNSAGEASATGGCPEPSACRVGCGNGRLELGLGETCDDGNDRAGDGCSADCRIVETNFVCPEPGRPCLNLVRCGDGKLAGGETCDDGNVTGGDGCSAGCEIEPGFDCISEGARCTPHCGDGALKGDEQCDAPNGGKGCGVGCRLEPGFVCAPPQGGPAMCHATVCGDRLREGAEACDDGNALDGDGCSAACALEPECSGGACVPRCGDQLRISPEECDDGNNVDGDGCDRACRIENGFSCAENAASLPNSLNLTVTYRDFVSFPIADIPRHPDFESAFAADERTPGLVRAELGADGKPQLEGRCSSEQPSTSSDRSICPYGQMLTTRANFDQWYRDEPSVNVKVPARLLLSRLANGSYAFDSAPMGFYPIDGRGFLEAPAREATATADPNVNDGKEHNFGFTTELRYFFQYRGGESLTFSGDDDLWIFINRRLALDVGGLHPRAERTLIVDQVAKELGLSSGGLYEIALFHAERHSAGSNFKLTLTGFVGGRSNCLPTCGDGVVVAAEQCDDGRSLNDGRYGGCTSDCKRGPHCGDGIVQVDDESCDDGVNLTVYGAAGAPRCAPGCVLSAYCGDGKVDGLFGEQCDLGASKNTGAYGGCDRACQFAPRCGDGMLQTSFGETCDDGNTVSGDGCRYDCVPELR